MKIRKAKNENFIYWMCGVIIYRTRTVIKVQKRYCWGYYEVEIFIKC